MNFRQKQWLCLVNLFCKFFSVISNFLSFVRRSPFLLLLVISKLLPWCLSISSLFWYRKRPLLWRRCSHLMMRSIQFLACCGSQVVRYTRRQFGLLVADGVFESRFVNRQINVSPFSQVTFILGYAYIFFQWFILYFVLTR